MLALAWHYRYGCIKVLSLRFIQLLAMIIGLTMIGLGIDVVRHAASDAPDGLAPIVYPFGLTPAANWTAFNTVCAIAVAIVILAVIRFIFERASTVAVGELVHRGIVVDLRAQVYDKLQRLSFRFFDSNDSGSIINRVTSDVARVGGFINGVVLQFINIMITMGIAMVYMLKISPKLTLVSLMSTPILLIVCVWYARTVKPAYKASQKLIDNLILTLSEHLQGIHVVKGFARHDEEIEKFEKSNETVKTQRSWIFWKLSLFTPTITFLTQVNVIILLIYGGYLVNHPDVGSRLALGSGLVVFAGLLTQFSAQVTTLANITNTIQVCLTSSQRVFEVLDTPMEIESRPNAQFLKKPESTVRFENVTFGYKPEEPVLEDISFEVRGGSSIAIVGATGSGKSTMMSLVSRFYDPTLGSVYIDDINVRDLDVDDLRRHIGLVFQESFLFSNTVSANIAFGAPNASQEQIEKAARIASAHDFIMDLSDGYDTVIGEKGGDLSGGQRQRLAIARAVLLEPSILILDDATAAIDPRTEHEILQSMESAMKNRTTFIVAHRLSTLRKADQVIVLEKGKIVQVGTHDQLMSTRGHYRRAARYQTADAESKRLLGIDGKQTA